MIKQTLRNLSLAMIAALSFATFTAAQTSPAPVANIDIANFGQMDEHYYRGAQPKPEDMKPLAAIGVKTVVDLRDDAVSWEKAAVEAAGMNYVNIPMSGFRSVKDADIVKFLQVANDPSMGTIYVHCAGGIHRTGVTGAIYRFEKYGWNYDKAYQEMKNYKFTTGLVHGALKSYVENYAKHLDAEKAAGVAAATK
jgi:protein tyrosine/serine phosphatase